MAEEKTKKRITATKVPIKAILNGQYVKESEEWQPNFIKYGELKIARVNVIAIALETSAGDNQVLIEDYSGKINVRGFDTFSIKERVGPGDVLQVFGRPREFNAERYILPEIIKKIDGKWMKYRKLELKNFKDADKEADPAEEKVVEEPVGIVSKHEEIIAYIREKDQGEGVLREEIMKQVGFADSSIIENLIRDGEIFENMPNKLKILE